MAMGLAAFGSLSKNVNAVNKESPKKIRSAKTAMIPSMVCYPVQHSLSGNNSSASSPFAFSWHPSMIVNTFTIGINRMLKNAVTRVLVRESYQSIAVLFRLNL